MNTRILASSALSLVLASGLTGCVDATADLDASSDSDSDEPPTMELLDIDITAINVLTPEEADRLHVLELLTTGIDQHMRHLDGFGVSAIHQSLDSVHVLNIARWGSVEALGGAAEFIGSGAAPEMGEAFSLGAPQYHPYTLAEQWTTADDTPYVEVDRPIVTVINILDPTDVAPDLDSETLAADMIEAIDAEVLQQPGFISATLYQSLDSGHVVNYAQWASAEALEAMGQRVESGDAPLMGAVFAAVPPDPHLYEPHVVIQ